MAAHMPYKPYHRKNGKGKSRAEWGGGKEQVVAVGQGSYGAMRLRTIASDPKHLEPELGFFAVLHNWGQYCSRSPISTARRFPKTIYC